jgi:glycopeptide antibiotics resistance protein
LTVLILSIITYSELSPFDWVRSSRQIPIRISKIEWLPFTSYYKAEPQSVLFDLAKKLFLLAPLGFLIAADHRQGSPKRRDRFAAAAAGLIVGLVLESAQVALESRTPSITDVLIFGVTAWAGAVIFERYRRTSDANNSPASSQVPPAVLQLRNRLNADEP